MYIITKTLVIVNFFMVATICKLPLSASPKSSFKKLQLHSLPTETICFKFNSPRGRGQNFKLWRQNNYFGSQNYKSFARVTERY